MSIQISRRRLLAAWPLGLAPPMARASQASMRYAVQHLPLDDESSARIAGMAGDFVAGNSFGREIGQTGLTAMLWDQRHLHFRRPFGGMGTGIWAVNSLGTSVGHCSAPGRKGKHAVSIPLDAPAKVLLPRSVDTTSSLAVGINELGVIVGYYTPVNDWRIHGFRWANGVPRLLPSPSPDCVNLPTGINAEGSIVGSNAFTIDGQWIHQAYVCLGEEVATLPSLPQYKAYPSAINDRGWIVGSHAPIDRAEMSPVLWRRRAGGAYELRRLPMPRGAVDSIANAVNEDGVVVGKARFDWTSDLTRERAWVWRRGELLLLDDVVGDLPEGWHVTDATAIDAEGRIGVMLRRRVPDGQTRVLTPAVLHPIAS
jgi:hypothetical protein